MVNERQEMLEQSATIYFGPWYRRSPFFDATRRAGCTAYDVYNHMLLPAYFDDPVVEYWALLNDVTVWDVAVERTVEISGPDADRFVDSLTCRDLTRCAVKQGKYMIVTAPDGGILNDPVLLHVGEDRWWMQLADSDAGLYALGAASRSNLDVEVSYPHAYPMQVQGAKAAKTLEKLVGPAVLDLKYYWCDWFDVGDIPVLISRTGWTAVQGFEINLLDPARGDDLWNAVFAAGEEFGIRPVAPVEARRIEAGIMNYNSDMTHEDTPLHLMGLEHLVEDQPQDYIGKAALESLKAKGVDRKLVGIEWSGDELKAELSWFWPVVRDGEQVGTGHRRRLVAEAREEHRVRVGADRAGRARDEHRRRVRARTDHGHDRRDPVHRRPQGGPGGLPARLGSAPVRPRSSMEGTRVDRRPPQTAPPPTGLPARPPARRARHEGDRVGLPHVRAVHPALDGAVVPDALPEEPAERPLRRHAAGRELRGAARDEVRLGLRVGGLAAPAAVARSHPARRAAGRLAAPGNVVVGEPRDGTRPAACRRVGRDPRTDPGRETRRMTEEAPRSHLHRLLQAGEFVVTAELQTSDSADPARIAELAGTLRGKVDAVNCTDNSAAHAHIAAIAAARLLLDRGRRTRDAARLPRPQPARPAGRPPRARRRSGFATSSA